MCSRRSNAARDHLCKKNVGSVFSAVDFDKSNRFVGQYRKGHSELGVKNRKERLGVEGHKTPRRCKKVKNLSLIIQRILESMRSVLRRVVLGSWGDHMSPLFKKI